MAREMKLVTRPAPDAKAAAAFADATSAFASGVVLVTGLVDGRPWGTTVTAFACVSAAPPTVLVSLGSRSAAARAIVATARFGVGVLAAEHEALAELASGPGAPEFLDPFESPDAGATPAVPGSLAHLDCDLTDAIPVADHTLFVGRVRAARSAAGGAPLVYHRRAYRALGPAAPPPGALSRGPSPAPARP